MNAKKFTIFLLTTLFIFISCSFGNESDFKTFSFEGETQGTYYRITYCSKKAIVTHEEIKELLQNFLQTASLWEPNSIISHINKNEPTALNYDFITIFNNAQEVSKATEGAFDITVGDLVNLWGFGFKEKEDPDKKKIDSLLKYVGYQNIAIINNQIVKKFPETSIDFNAIAKGYSVDLVAQFLKSKKVENFLVDIGGEIYASGLKPDHSKWNIGIEKPASKPDDSREIQSVISLSNKAIATSGSYRKFRVIDSVQYSHTIDPHTGYPVAHTLLSATVIAENCTIADALATSFMVMGKEKAMEYLQLNPQFEGYFIYSNPDGTFGISCTEGFKIYLQ